MKSIYKRFFALCLSMLMIFSMSAVAFAAEAEEKSDVALGEVLSEATMIASATSANADGYGNVTGNLSGSTANNLQVNFRVPDGGAYLYFIYSSEDYQRVTVRKTNYQKSSLF
ncbi:MAG: hypothetical protein HFJ52_01615 [Clostridia bacterium]|nr:hypothetical protein [Clostridia bacterium]